jgi:outer membrane protein W
MKRSFLRALAASSFASLLVTLVTVPAAAQGSMTPNQPPAEGGATGTPSQPPANPPAAPPPVVTAPPAAAGDLTEVPEEKRHDAPPPHTGFQIAARAGVAIPLGDAAKDTPLSDGLGAQFAAIVDIGGKIVPQVFLGAYLGGNVGAVGSQTSKDCDTVRATGCLGLTYRIGVQVQYHIIPDGKVDPWLGYGIGYEVSRVTGSAPGTTYSTTLVGPEYGHILAGVDFRVTKIFGIGPFVDFSFGKYTNASSEPSGKSAEIPDKAMHEWLTIGAKFLFFP